jgi:hypothetical protein
MSRAARTRQLLIPANTTRMLGELEQISKTVKLTEPCPKPASQAASEPTLVIRGK